jgi:hypothetical protein
MDKTNSLFAERDLVAINDGVIVDINDLCVLNDGVCRVLVDIDDLKNATEELGWNIGKRRWIEPEHVGINEYGEPIYAEGEGGYQALCAKGLAIAMCPVADIDDNDLPTLTFEPAEQPNFRTWIFYWS